MVRLSHISLQVQLDECGQFNSPVLLKPTSFEVMTVNIKTHMQAHRHMSFCSDLM